MFFYFDIDLDRVWDTVTDDLLPVIAALEKVVTPESVDLNRITTRNRQRSLYLHFFVAFSGCL